MRLIIKYLLLSLTILILFFFSACDTLISDQEPTVKRKPLETLELRGDDVVIDLAEAYPNHTFQRVEARFADKVTTLPNSNGVIRYVRYIPGDLFDQPFNMELVNSRNESVISTLNLREASESSNIQGCRENTLEFTVKSGTTFFLDLFEEEDFCEWKDDIKTIIMSGLGEEVNDPGSIGMQITIDEENPENNLLFFKHFSGNNIRNTNTTRTGTTGFEIAINYPEGMGTEALENPELAEYYIRREIKVTIE